MISFIRDNWSVIYQAGQMNIPVHNKRAKLFKMLIYFRINRQINKLWRTQNQHFN